MSTLTMTLILAIVCRTNGVLPDKHCTPGAVDPRVTPQTIQQTICRPGYTATIRPPVAYTDHLKRVQMAQYGLTGLPSAYEEDHLIPLELGGHPTDPRNLWPQSSATKATKDRIENYLHREVCLGLLPLSVAQHAMATDWTIFWLTAYHFRKKAP